MDKGKERVAFSYPLLLPNTHRTEPCAPPPLPPSPPMGRLQLVIMSHLILNSPRAQNQRLGSWKGAGCTC